MDLIKITDVHRTYDAWSGDLGTYLQVGDSVDTELQSHFLEVLYPAYFDRSLIQMGEAADHYGADGQPRFLTIQQKCDGRWIYTGPRKLRERVDMV
jgi:hypothetical protein